MQVIKIVSSFHLAGPSLAPAVCARHARLFECMEFHTGDGIVSNARLCIVWPAAVTEKPVGILNEERRDVLKITGC